MVPFARLYRLMISTALKIRLGDEYYDVVKGTDVFLSSDTWKNSLIKSFLVIEYNKTITKKDFFDYSKEVLQKIRDEKIFHQKFFCKFFKFMGYLFHVKVDAETSEYLQKFPRMSNTNLDRNKLIAMLGERFYEPLPLNGTALWDVYIGTQPIAKWRQNSDPNIEYYPLLFRTHHGISDGMALAKTIMLACPNDKKVDESTNFEPKEPLLIRVFKSAVSWFRVGIILPSALYIFFIMKGHDFNDLHGNPYTDTEALQWNIDEDGCYFQKVMKIKQRYKNTSFPEILVAAFGASLYEYYQKYCTHCPEKVTVSYPVVPDPHLVRRIRSGQIDSNISVATNNFTFLQMFLPVDISKNKNFDKNSPLTSRLNIIKKEIDLLKDSAELQLSYVLINIILGSLPIWFATKFLKSIQNTAACSFLPGPPKLKYCENIYEIADSLFWIPHIAQLGIGITTITYDNRLAVGINSNSDIAEQSRAEEVIKNFLKYIDVMEEEVDRLYCKNHVD